MPLSQARSEGESFENIRLLDIREVGEQLFDGAAGRHGSDDHADGHAHAPDARLAAHNLGIHRDAVELLHVDYDSAAVMSCAREVYGCPQVVTNVLP